jgi:hypothetical protein
MDFKKYLLIFTAILAFNAWHLTAQNNMQDESAYEQELNENDFSALRDFLRDKRIENLEEEGENKMVISADVRTEWRYLTERQQGKNLRGHHAVFRGVPVSRNDFDIEMNLYFDYLTARTWAVAQIQYDNSAGVDDNDKSCEDDPEGYHGSGEKHNLNLKKAFFGYNLFDTGCSRFDIELGRRTLYNVFDSRVQFLSRFDGLLLSYSYTMENVGEAYIMAAGFVVDERVNHLAWITECGILNILDSGIDFKYSFIDWRKNGINKCFVHDPKGLKFENSQFTLAYNFKPEIICQRAQIFGAFLINHAGVDRYYRDDDDVKHHKRHQNKAWYAGVLLGRVEKEGDWSLEIQYQWVQAFSMPDKDMSGIGRGNVHKDSITAPGARGNTNFKGWRFEGLYAITDELTINPIFEFSQAICNAIGGSHHYSKFELETVYAF